MQLDLANIGGVNGAIAISIANQNGHWNHDVADIVPVFTLDKVTAILCALVTPIKLTITVAVPLAVKLLTMPMPEVIATLARVTALGKSTTIW